MMWSLYEIIYICTAIVDESEEWSSQKIFQFKQLERRSLKTNQGFNAIRTRDVRDTGAMLYQLSYEAAHWARDQFIEFISSRAAEVTGSNPVEALIFFRLLLSNCLNWKIYCDDQISLSYTTAVQIWIISYKLHIISLHEKIRTQWIDLAPNVWLHSSVGRASHRYRGGHGFESHWSLDFFRLLLSNCLNWKIYCVDHSSLSLIFQVYFCPSSRSASPSFQSFLTIVYVHKRSQLVAFSTVWMCGH